MPWFWRKKTRFRNVPLHRSNRAHHRAAITRERGKPQDSKPSTDKARPLTIRYPSESDVVGFGESRVWRLAFGISHCSNNEEAGSDGRDRTVILNADRAWSRLAVLKSDSYSGGSIKLLEDSRSC